VSKGLSGKTGIADEEKSVREIYDKLYMAEFE
jgi:hypothetical protein